MRILANSTKGLFPLQKHLLYCSCIISIATYGFRLWLFAGAPTKAQISFLATLQYKTALWILGTFHTLLTGKIEALAGLIPIHLHFKKLAKQSCLRTVTFSLQHVLISLLSIKYSKSAFPYQQSFAFLNDIQYDCLKGSLLDTEASLLNLTEYFNSLAAEATLGCMLLDNLPDCIFFYFYNYLSLSSCKTYIQFLDHLCLKASFSPPTLAIVTNRSVIPSRCIQAVSAVYL